MEWRIGDVHQSKSKLYLFSLDGDLIWKHDLSWQGWNADLSPDGKYAAFVTSMCDKKLNVLLEYIETATGKTLGLKKLNKSKLPNIQNSTQRKFKFQIIINI